jgi:hypothetical protein
MTTGSLPPLISRYCIICGALLTFTDITTSAGQGQASWTCSRCGDKSGVGWTEFSSSKAQRRSDDQLMPPPQFPAVAPMPPVIPDAARAAQAQTKALQQQIDAHGVVAIVQAAHFPLFALSDIHGRFLPQGHGWGGGEWSEGKVPRPLSSFHLEYAGPSHQHVAERIIIGQEDREAHPQFSIAEFLADLPDPDVPGLRLLWEGGAIYQFVNVETVREAPVVYARIELQSGEAVLWSIRRFNAPLPIAHAQAQIERTRIDVGAIGPAAEDLEQVLGHLTQLTPESATLDQLNQGLQAWSAYLQHHYWSSDEADTS